MRTLFLLAALPLLARLGHGEGAPPAVPSIPVVRTWGDLIGTKPIPFEQVPEGGVLTQAQPVVNAQHDNPSFRIWIGIDRDEVGAHGAVVLYCLTKNIRFSTVSDDRLGPFHIEGQAPRQAQTLLADDQAASYTLYAKSVPVKDAGEYVIELSDASVAKDKTSPQVYARIKVHVAPSKNSHSWSPWNESDDAAKVPPAIPSGASMATDADPEMVMTVGNPASGVALPKASDQGEGSLVKDLPPGSTPLPRMELEKPDSTLHLTMEGLSLRINVMNNGIDLTYPDDHFLTRWWVNGKPWASDSNNAEPGRPRVGDMQLSKDGENRIRFDLDFKPERLGVKKGDKVGLQLLFCPKGWEYAPAPASNQAQAEIQTQIPKEAQSLPNFSSPSNRINFIYSGDPLHPQQTPPK